MNLNQALRYFMNDFSILDVVNDDLANKRVQVIFFLGGNRSLSSGTVNRLSVLNHLADLLMGFVRCVLFT